jgi:O-antigen/teichoic acid export membrane protein
VVGDVLSRISRFHLLKKAPRGGFARNVLTMMTGTAIAQGVTIITAPVLTRIYEPEDFGIFAILTMIVSVLSVVICWRYELAIVLPEKDKDALNVLALCIVISIFMSFIVLIVIALFHKTIALMLGEAKLEEWMWFIPPSLLVIGIYKSFNYWFSRKNQFNQIAISKVSQSTSTVSSQVGIGLLENGPLGLIGGQIFGQIVAMLFLVKKFLAENKDQFISNITVFNLKSEAKKFKKHPLYNTWPSLLDSLTLAMPIIFMSNVFGVIITGYYSLAMRVTSIPISIVGSSVAQVILPKLAAEVKNTGEIATIIENTLRKLVFGGLLLLLLLQLSPFVFGAVFGETWKISGLYAQIMAFAVTIRFIVSPLSGVFIVCERQEIIAGWQMGYIASTTVMLSVSSFFSNPIATLLFLVMNDLVLYSIYLVLILKVSKANLANVFKFNRK